MVQRTTVVFGLVKGGVGDGIAEFLKCNCLTITGVRYTRQSSILIIILMGQETVKYIKASLLQM